MPSTKTQIGLKREIKKLQKLDLPSLRSCWLNIYKSPPPKSMSKDLLIRALAYELQVTALGGLKATLKKRLQHISSDPSTSGTMELAQWLNRPAMKLGTRMVRTWKGELHSVTAIKEGFDYRGTTYSSLSKIAYIITGTKWSGPTFFGLNSTIKPNDN